MDNGYEEFQQIMAEIKYKKQMEENRKKFGLNYDLPPGFDLQDLNNYLMDLRND